MKILRFGFLEQPHQRRIPPEEIVLIRRLLYQLAARWLSDCLFKPNSWASVVQLSDYHRLKTSRAVALLEAWRSSTVWRPVIRPGSWDPSASNCEIRGHCHFYPGKGNSDSSMYKRTPIPPSRRSPTCLNASA